ncbi:MAG: hypothetical protein JXB40_01650 [Candidatus Omnitrophica bacterium]|nr:hypothetical protein [Candidatus Omnitrophota bacterium]
MKLRYCGSLLAIALITLLFAVPVFSQESDENNVAPVSAPASIPEELQPKEIAIYGEVQVVDTDKGIATIQYYDYDSDSEKSIDVLVNDYSKLENASKLGDVKKGDWVDVTYIEMNGNNEARVVTVEKEEMPAAEEAPSTSSSAAPSE